MRGFGFEFDIRGGTVRNWYAGEDGIRRWADNDQPMDTPVPNRPVPMESEDE